MTDLENFKPQFMLPNESCKNPKDLVDQIDILNKEIKYHKHKRKEINIINGITDKTHVFRVETCKELLRCHHLALGLMRGRTWQQIDWHLDKEKMYMKDRIISKTLTILANCYIPVHESIGMFISSLL